jgi:RNA polymerase sigma-70 factor (ECF subfamily)
VNDPQPVQSLHESGTRTSSSLLEGVRANDAEAWRRLVKLYSPLVYTWAKRCGLENQDAADVLQEVFCAVSRFIAGFERNRSSGSFRGWLWTVTRNKVRDHFRDKQASAVGGSEMHLQLQEIPEEEPPSWSGDGEIGRGQLMRRALEIIRNDFEPQTWQAFWRLAVENQPAADVARDLHLGIDSVYQAKSRVLRRLREELRERVDS